jgi:hypothetical protein
VTEKNALATEFFEIEELEEKIAPGGFDTTNDL